MKTCLALSASAADHKMLVFAFKTYFSAFLARKHVFAMYYMQNHEHPLTLGRTDAPTKAT